MVGNPGPSHPLMRLTHLPRERGGFWPGETDLPPLKRMCPAPKKVPGSAGRVAPECGPPPPIPGTPPRQPEPARRTPRRNRLATTGARPAQWRATGDAHGFEPPRLPRAFPRKYRPADLRPDASIAEKEGDATIPFPYGMLPESRFLPSGDAHAAAPSQAQRRWRPRARRAAKTRRPFAVAMRARKPWVRFRRRLCG